ncbi:MAG: hypothetical protein HY739_05355 [Desulfobacterales bacterium]|nr:hypothetical protein [Desulfobacterales bacterium]
MIEKILLGIFPVLIGVLITSIVTRKYKDKERFNIAYNTLHEAFASELSTLENPTYNKTVDPHKLLTDAFNKHRTAATTFRHFLEEPRKREFNQAWRNYYAQDDYEGEETTEFLFKYSPYLGNNTVKECTDMAIANIEKLLKVAKHK